MPNSVKVGDRPSIRSMRSYSSVVSPCSATSAGVIVGSPGRGSGFTCLGMMEDLENVAHEAAHWASGLMNMSNQADLALIEPDAVAVLAGVDFYVLEISLLEIAAALRTFHEVLAALDLAPLLIEQRAQLLDQQRVLACEILVFVAGRMFFGLPMHGPPTLARYACTRSILSGVARTMCALPVVHARSILFG